MNITTMDIDLAKNTFQIYGVDKRRKNVLSKALTGAKFPEISGTGSSLSQRGRNKVCGIGK